MRWPLASRPHLDAANNALTAASMEVPHVMYWVMLSMLAVRLRWVSISWTHALSHVESPYW